jgi:hypothetical protein
MAGMFPSFAQSRAHYPVLPKKLITSIGFLISTVQKRSKTEHLQSPTVFNLIQVWQVRQQIDQFDACVPAHLLDPLTMME